MPEIHPKILLLSYLVSYSLSTSCFFFFWFQHWSEWLPFLPKPDIRIFDKEDTKTRPMIVNFPFQSFSADKHAVDPDIHYELSSKTRIPEMGAPCPRYMSRDNYTLPCMIKTTQGVGGRGVFLARNKDEAQNAFRELKTNFHCQEPVITEVIQHIKEFLNVQLYLFQNGDFHWLGEDEKRIRRFARFTKLLHRMWTGTSRSN